MKATGLSATTTSEMNMKHEDHDIVVCIEKGRCMYIYESDNEYCIMHTLNLDDHDW